MDDDPDESDFEWDRDSGIKDHPGCEWNHGHIRVYATGSGDHNYNPSYGYYVVATIHRDHENPYSCEKRYESFESDEDWWNARMEDNLGSDTEYNWTVYDSSIYWGNGVSGTLNIGSDDPDTHR